MTCFRRRGTGRFSIGATIHVCASARFLFVACGALAVSSSACTKAAPPHAAPSGTSSMGSAQPDLVPGSAVSVSRGGRVWPAHVVRQVAADRYLVHYDGLGAEWDEVVGNDRIAGRSPVALAHDYHVGEKVLVSAQGRRLAGDVIAPVGPDLWRVHYDGYGPEVAESVGPERLARPFPGPTAHPAGEAVGIEVSGRVMPAKVVAALAADRWLVRFDGFGAQYDQEVAPDRLRAAPVMAPVVATPPPAPPPPPEPIDKAKADKTKGKGKGDKKPDAAPAAPVVPTGPPQVGDAVLVAQRGGFFAAGTVVAVGVGSFRVHYEGPGAASDEDVAADRIARAAAPLKGVKYQANQPVFIEWHGVFVGGKVLKESGDGAYKVRFDGFGPDSDEVVQVKRLRPRS
jgi:hypothetical protein